MTLPEAEQHLSLALEAAVTRFGAMVRQVGRRYRLDESGLDEVMQEVRIRLWRARETSEQVGETNTSYVYRTASSAALDILRRRRARQADRHDAIEDEGSMTVLTAREPDPHTKLEGSELADRVTRAIDQIPDSRRPAVRMYLIGRFALPTTPESEVVRSGSEGGVTLVAPPPESPAGSPLLFAWHPISGASRYRLEVLTSEGEVALEAETADTAVTLESAAGLAPGDYKWWVGATSAGTTSRSALRPLRLTAQ